MMWKRLRNRLQSEKGVTLIELMAVVAILAIIAVVAVPMITSSMADAKANTDKQNAKILSDAVARYRIDNDGDLPDDREDLVPDYLQEMPERNVALEETCDDTKLKPEGVSDAKMVWCMDENGKVE